MNRLEEMKMALRTLQTEEQGGPSRTVTISVDDFASLLAIAETSREHYRAIQDLLGHPPSRDYTLRLARAKKAYWDALSVLTGGLK